MDTINNNDIELQQEDRIISFLQGKMTPDEELKFKEELQADSALKEKAVNMARLSKGLSQVGIENDKVLKEAILSSDEKTIRKIALQATSTINGKGVAKKILYRKYATILTIAASLLFIIYFGFLYHDYNKTLSLGERYAMKYESSVVRGDENPDISKEVELLINNVYNNHDLDKTLKRLAVLWEVSTLETYNDYTEYAPQIGWALATGYLKDNNKKRALIVLEKMVTLYDVNTTIGQKVRDLNMKITKP